MFARQERAAAAAARWYARLHADDTSDGDRAAFARWRDADPEHDAAWKTVEKADHLLRVARQHPELAGMIAAARSPAATRGTPAFRYAAAAAVVLAVGATAMLSVEHGAPPGRAPAGRVHASGTGDADAVGAARVYASGTGQVRQVRLPDGSDMTLDAQSRAAVTGSADERRVTLVAGRALFDVAKNPARPFVVTANGARVTALGTHFTVASGLDGVVTVALLEGSVRVDGAGRTRTLVPGDVLTLGRASLMLKHAAAEREAGWRDGRLTFDAVPLAQVVADLNRYAPHPVTIADRGLAARPFSGSLRTRDGVEGLIAALDAYGIATARKQPDQTWALTSH